MTSHHYGDHLKTTLILLLITTIFTTIAFAEQPEFLTGNQIQQQAAWLNDINDYDFEAEITFGAQGINLTSQFHHKTLGNDFFKTDYSIPMMRKHFLCNGDSLYTTMPDYSTYSVEPWPLNVTGDIPDGPLLIRLMHPPYPFSILQMLVAPILEDKYELIGEDDLELDGQTIRCEIWNNIQEADSKDYEHLWIDSKRRIVLKREGSAVAKNNIATSFESKILSLETDVGLTHEDFVFIPQPGIKRVATPSKMLVSNSLEGKTFTDLDFTDLSGSIVNSAQWRGKIVLLDFWATWCSPCKKSLPHLRKLQADFNEEIIVVGITNEKMTTVEAFFKEDPSTYPILLDVEGKATEQYQVEALPTLFVLDANGKILDHFVGYQEESVIRKAIEAALTK